ncbi:MAG: biotin/lipoyl-containing protein, partial [Steroidobacteraceae bacterium]
MSAAAPLVEVRVPDLGSFKDVAVIDVLVKPGESVAPETPLITLESDKATMDVPSTAGGVIEKVHVAKGGTVSTGDLVATVRSAADTAQAARAPSAAPARKPAATTAPPAAP